MAKVERMTLGGIENFVEVDELKNLGLATISETFWGNGIKISLGGASEEIPFRGRDIKDKEEFLSLVETTLKNKDWYLADVEYLSAIQSGKFPMGKHKMYGQVYARR
jgi:hypothetical protein